MASKATRIEAYGLLVAEELSPSKQDIEIELESHRSQRHGRTGLWRVLLASVGLLGVAIATILATHIVASARLAFGVNSSSMTASIREYDSARFDGAWDQGTIQGNQLTLNTGDNVPVRIVSASSLQMTFQGQAYNAKLEADGTLHWDDGEVWTRVGQASSALQPSPLPSAPQPLPDPPAPAPLPAPPAPQLPAADRHRHAASCKAYGCDRGYHPEHACQCNDGCLQHNNCCSDFHLLCQQTDARTSDGAVDTTASSAAADLRAHVDSHQQQTREQPKAQDGFYPPAKVPTKNWQPPVEPGERSAACSERSSLSYQLDWQAKGSDFFKEWNFLLNDPNKGSAQYVPRDRAWKEGILEANAEHAVIKAGPKGDSPFKRLSVKIETKREWKYFLAAIKLNHIPYGCGVWPALWTHTLHVGWPNGGELDILEYTNEWPSRTSFHVGHANHCRLDPEEVNKPGCQKFVDAEVNFTANYDCITDYPKKIGCAPNRLPLLPADRLSESPFIMVAEWTESFLKVFQIPANEAPAELEKENGQPRPDEWDQWLFAYYPFAASERKNPGSCPNYADVMAAQRIIISLGFCGDWPSKVWVNSTMCANREGWNPQFTTPRIPDECEAIDPLHHRPDQVPGGPKDCCTQFIYDADGKYGTDSDLPNTAKWDISWIKVFQAS